MDVPIIIFLSSGLFLGWSLGANDAANVFGTAVGSRMIRFVSAAVICSIFVILGAVFSGAGAAHGLGKLGSVNALPGAFMVAFTAALTVYWMTKASLPVSTTQAIVGAIVGWNLFSGSLTDMGQLARIFMTWVACPILGAFFSFFIYKLTVAVIYGAKVNLFRLDFLTRAGLILAGAFGAYSLGANNIANVMGVFVPSSPFQDTQILGSLTVTSTHKLFLLGAIAIAVGVFTYSKRVMMTVGRSIIPLNPVAAWVVVLSHSIVLFLFSSTALEHFLLNAGLPAIPLIPVSSSQAVIGAVIGIGLCHGRRSFRQIKWRSLLTIASGWVATPVIAAISCFFLLFFLANVFGREVYRETYFEISPQVMERLEERGIPAVELQELSGERIAKARDFRHAVREHADLESDAEAFVLSSAELHPMLVDGALIESLNGVLEPAQIEALRRIEGRRFSYKWQLRESLAAESPLWEEKDGEKINRQFNEDLNGQFKTLYELFSVTPAADSAESNSA